MRGATVSNYLKEINVNLGQQDNIVGTSKCHDNLNCKIK